MNISHGREIRRTAYRTLAANRPLLVDLVEAVEAATPPTREPEYGRQFLAILNTFEAIVDGLDGPLVRLAWEHVHAIFTDGVYIQFQRKAAA